MPLPDRPYWDKERPEDIPLWRLLKRMFDKRTADEFMSYFGPIFDQTEDSLSVKTEIGTVEFVEGQPGPGDTSYTLTMQFKNLAGEPMKGEDIEVSVWDNEGISDVALNAILKNVTKGSLVSASLTNKALKVRTDPDDGEVVFDVEDFVGETVYVWAGWTFGSPVISGRNRIALTFAP